MPLHLREVELDAGACEVGDRLVERVCGRRVDVRHRLGRDDEPADRGINAADHRPHPVAEEVRVREEQGRVPAVEEEPRHLPRVRVPFDIVVALVIRDASKDRVVRPPGMPDEVEEREAHGDPDPGQDAEDDDAEEAGDRQSELGPAEAEEPTRASEVEQAQGGGDDDRGQGRRRQVGEQAGCRDEHEDDDARAHQARHLRPGAGRLRDWRPGRAAADREAADQTGGDVGDAQRGELMVWVHRLATAGGERPRDDAGVGECHEGDPERAGDERQEVGEADGRDPGGGEAARDGADHGELLPEPEDRDDERGQDDRDKDAREAARGAAKDQDHDERTAADQQRDGHDPAVEDAPDDPDRLAQEIRPGDREAHQLRDLAHDHGQGDAVHVADADRSREQVGQEPEPRGGRADTDGAHHQGERGGEGHGAPIIAAGERDDRGRDGSDERRVRPQHEDP